MQNNIASDPTMKRCSGCWEMRSPLEYYSGERGTTLCKKCMSERGKARSRGNIESLFQARIARDLSWVEEYKKRWPELIYSHDGEWADDELWRPCVGWEGFYEVSDHGRIRSLFINRHKRPIRRTVPRILKQHKNKLGYKSCSFVTHGVNGKRRKATQNVHSLVLLAFCGSRPENHVCGHRDGNPSNNHLSNLQWITYVENERDKRLHGRNLPGSKNHQAKLTEKAVVKMRAEFAAGEYEPKELAKRYGVSAAVTYKILNRKSWCHV